MSDGTRAMRTAVDLLEKVQPRSYGKAFGWIDNEPSEGWATVCCENGTVAIRKEDWDKWQALADPNAPPAQ